MNFFNRTAFYLKFHVVSFKIAEALLTYNSTQLVQHSKDISELRAASYISDAWSRYHDNRIGQQSAEISEFRTSTNNQIAELREDMNKKCTSTKTTATALPDSSDDD